MIGKRIAHYKIIEKLGQGGMGVVYKAHDTKLERNVAIKFLPPHVAANEEERERFKIEAKAAAALNHPNIATIHAIEEVKDEIFIVMEYIDGKELGNIVGANGDTPLPIDQIIDIVIQIAEGLQAAHTRGIVHRDIKSGNVMVTEDGKVKIMDFGLAKIGSGTHLTKPQSTIGTVAYMSPEQTQGEVVDGRTDIWAFGVILYELLTGELPFKGDYEQAIIYSILNEEPEHVENYRTDIPTELSHILFGALEKKPDDRFQSMTEVLREFRRLKKQTSRVSSIQPLEHGQTRENLSRTTSAQSSLPGKYTKKGILVILGGAAWLLAIFAGLWLLGIISPNKSPVATQKMQISRLTTSGNASQATISPDGNYVVYVQEKGGRESLWMRQVATTSNIEIVPAASTHYRGTTISHDGNFIYYVVIDDNNPSGGLYKVPILGGAPKKILTNLNSPIALSPDDKKLAYLRRYAAEGKESIIIANIDGSNEQELASRTGKAFFLASSGIVPSWSPDGKIIACGAGVVKEKFLQGVLGIDVETGKQKWITHEWLNSIQRVAWMNDGSGLVAVASVKESEPTNQLWFVSYPKGKMTRITNDLSNYGNFSLGLTHNNRTIVATQEEKSSNIWLAVDPDNTNFLQLSTGTRNDNGMLGISVSPDGKIVYTSSISGQTNLWMMKNDGSEKHQLTSNKNDFNPTFTPDGKYIFFASQRLDVPTIWRMDADGQNQQQITHIEEYESDVTPDGKWLLYRSFAGSGTDLIWKKSLAGGEPIQLSDKPSGGPAVSPNGKYFACLYESHPDSAANYAIFPINGGKPRILLSISPTASAAISWTPDGKFILYSDQRNGVSNIYRQSVEGGSPIQVTNFTDSEYIYEFNTTTDGRLVLAKGPQNSDVVLVRNFR